MKNRIKRRDRMMGDAEILGQLSEAQGFSRHLRRQTQKIPEDSDLSDQQFLPDLFFQECLEVGAQQILDERYLLIFG
jgi:hypothetical protein